MLRKSRVSTLAAATILTVSAPGMESRGVAAAADPNWEVMVWTAPLTVSVDKASIALHASRTIARVIWDYAEARSAVGQMSLPYKSMIGTVVFDCATLQFGAAGSVAYTEDGGDGEVVAQYSIDPDTAKLGEADPGTLGGDLVAYVCAHVPAKR